MSALPPEADMLIVGIDVCYVPKPDTIARGALIEFLGGRRLDTP